MERKYFDRAVLVMLRDHLLATADEWGMEGYECASIAVEEDRLVLHFVSESEAVSDKRVELRV